MLQRLAPCAASDADAGGVLPSWYGRLLELLTRHLRRPTSINDELRYAEWLAEAAMHKHPAQPADAFGPSYDPVTAKLPTDVCGFLVSVAELSPDFRAFARAALSPTRDGAVPVEVDPPGGGLAGVADRIPAVDEAPRSAQPRLPLGPGAHADGDTEEPQPGTRAQPRTGAAVTAALASAARTGVGSYSALVSSGMSRRR